MNEQFAQGGQNLYHERSRYKVMAEVTVPRPDEESKGVPKTNGETQKKESKAKERRRVQKEERAREQQATQKSPIEISFREAKKIAEVVTAVQAEKKVIVSPGELADFKKVLAKSGYQPEVVEKMTDAQIVVAAQQILKNAKITQAKESDWQYAPKSPSRKAEEALVREQIAKAQSLHEEQLTPAKVVQFLEVAEFAKAAEGGGPGAMKRAEKSGERAYTVQEKEFRRVTRETISKMKNLARNRLEIGESVEGWDDPEWQRLSGELRQLEGEFRQSVEQRRFLKVYDFVKLIEDAEYDSKNYEPPLPDGKEAIEILNSVLGTDQRKAFKKLRETLDDEFEELYKRMDDRIRAHILGDLELGLGTQLQGLIAGWHSPENVRNYIFGGIYQDYDSEGDKAGNPREVSGIITNVSSDIEETYGKQVVGIREWRAVTEIYGAEQRVSVDILTRPPARWQEVPERITRIYRFIEGTEFTVEQLQGYIQKALAMIESVQTDDPEGRIMLNDLNAELKSFQAFHSFRVTLERSSMDPEQVMAVFQNYFDDRTWVNFTRRFDHDSRMRKFINLKVKDERGEFKKINLLDEGWKLYMKQLEEERIKMNKIEELTKRDLDLDNLEGKDIDELWIILRMAHSRDYLDRSESFDKLVLETKEDIIKAIKGKLIAPTDPKDIEMREERLKWLKVWGWDLGQDNCRTEEVINDWYRRRTLLGAYRDAPDFEKDEKGQIKLDKEGKPITSQVNLLEERRKEMREKLKGELTELNLGVEKGEMGTKKLLDEMEREGFLDAVDANVYQLAWALAWSDFDIIRIYGRDRKTKKASKIPQAEAYNQFTKMFSGRMIDHFMDFIVDEERGRPYEVNEVNALFRKHLLGEHGNLLPQNRTMVRFARNFMSPKQRIEAERRARELMRIHNFVPTAGYNELLELEKELEKERLEHPENPQRDPYFEGFLGWARGAAIAEMIDSGEFGQGEDDKLFSFSQRGFSAAAPFISQYSMIDLYDDRVQTKKYFARKNLQGYMRDPSNERFLAINDKDSEFYSGRNIRLWPWMNIAFEAHWEIAHKHWKKLLNIDNLQSGGGEALVELLVLNGVMRKQQGENLKRKMFGFGPGLLGTVPFRRVRQYTDFTALAIWDDIKSPGFYLGSIWDFLKRLFAYVAGGFGGK